MLELAYDGAATARAHPDVLAALHDPRLRAVVICPSNPFVSIEPILAIGGLRQAIADCAAPVVAVSPIIGGRAVKGPTAKMMSELGLPVSAAAVARRYADLLDAYVLDHADAAEAGGLGIPVDGGAYADAHARRSRRRWRARCSRPQTVLPKKNVM